MMKRLVSPRPGAKATMSPRGVGPSLPRAIMCSDRNAAPAEVPAIGTPAALRRRSSRATEVPPSVVDSRSWSPPVRNTAVASPIVASVPVSSASARWSIRSTDTDATPMARNRV